MKKNITVLLLLLIIVFAFSFRVYNVNWDSGTHIHPDERFLTMVTNDMKIPNSFVDYLNPQVSTMNPHNINYSFFVYGTFPLYLVKIVAILLKMDNYGDITLLGRVVSAVFDTGVVIILFFLSKLLLNSKFQIPNSKQILNSKVKNNITIKQYNNSFPSFAPLLPPFLYSIMVLPIQLSHFFAVDTFLAFFMILSFYIALIIDHHISNAKWISVLLLSTLLGVTIGLGFASKVTMMFIVPLDLLIITTPLLHCFIASLLKKRNSHEVRNNNGTMEQWNNGYLFTVLTICGLLIAIVSYFFFRFAQPMAFADANFLHFTLNPKWIKNITDLQAMSSYSEGNTFPPSIQWFTTKPLIYPFNNLVLWGMGIPMAILCFLGIIKVFLFSAIESIKNTKLYLLMSPVFLLILYSLVFFIYQGVQFSKNMRYFYPIYWCLAIFGGLFLVRIWQSLTKIRLLFFIVATSLLIYPIAFFHIYTQPHSRVAASRWIFQNVKNGSHITFEEWDDPLPLIVDDNPLNVVGVGLPMFWPDTNPDKWKNITEKISDADYVFITSNRVYGSIPRRPDIYFLTKKYYQLLFAEKLGLKKVAEFHSRPTIPIIDYELIDDYADESFTVYDHPVVTIFKNEKRFSQEELTRILDQ